MEIPEFTVQMSEADTAWVAGLLEGEGCFYLSMRKNRDGTPRPLVSISCCMTDEDVILRLHRTISTGYITTRTPANPKWRQSWTWTDSNVNRVIPLIRHLQPHMGNRRAAKIDEMLAAAENWERRPMRGHGTVAMYRRGCKCAICRKANTRAHRDYLTHRADHLAQLATA